MWGTQQQRDTRQRKRDAVGNLRNLASELGVGHEFRKTDLTKAEFESLGQKVNAVAQTPEHKRRLKEAIETYSGSSDAHVLPILPNLPPYPAASNTDEADAKEFRIRSSSCLFTWSLNSIYTNENLPPCFEACC